MVANADNILDIGTLEQYCSAIGASTLLKSVVLFEQLMPEYIDNLVKASQNQEKDILCSEAHKFKGAAGSVGLKRIQQYAQLLQHGEASDWEPMHQQWLAVVVEHTPQDLVLLKEYLEAKI